MARDLSYAKAVDVYTKLESHYAKLIVIGADTVVSYQGKTIGKPIDKVDAINTLINLQSHDHEVITGMTVCYKNETTVVFETVSSQSIVHMRGMTHDQIMEYVNSGEPMDKAGSYAIQGQGGNYVKGYEGEYNTIVGLDTKKLREIFLKYNMFEEKKKKHAES